uniref:Uncharacterized protein n=1 Tax=uncultured marine virus TaxID=186617 RepID=A0A0F7L9I1_9VIRU|nr:hypothetical protein [uncultured marine virus]
MWSPLPLVAIDLQSHDAIRVHCVHSAADADPVFTVHHSPPLRAAIASSATYPARVPSSSHDCEDTHALSQA